MVIFIEFVKFISARSDLFLAKEYIKPNPLLSSLSFDEGLFFEQTGCLAVLFLLNCDQMKTVFKRIWACYGMIVMSFFIMGYTLLAFPVLLIFGKRSERLILKIGYKLLARLISILLLIRYKLRSKISVSKKESYVLVSNHKSIVDVFASEVTSPVIFKFLGKIATGRIPVWGLLIRRLCVLIDRSSKVSKQFGYQTMARNLKAGFSIFIFPEGTRNITTQPLKQFYNGAFRLAIEEKKSILVQTLIGSEKITNPLQGFNLSPGNVTVYWDGPIDTTGYTLDNLEELRDRVKAIMLDRIKKHCD